MERKVTVMSNKGANVVVIESNATTLGELKGELSAAGVSYDGMAIFEGVSRTTLMDDASILPSNLPYKGVVTNDLVILLSPKDKKITSGASAREAAYAAVKANNLQSAVVARFGRNFTQVSTIDLVEFVATQTANKETKSTAKPEAPKAPVAEAKQPENNQAIAPGATQELSPLEAVMVGFAILVNDLYEEGIVGDSTIENINAAYGGRFASIEVVTEAPVEEATAKLESPYSHQELGNMFDFVDKR